MPVKVQTRISDELAARLDAEVTRLQAQHPGSETNRSTVIRAAITAYLENKKEATPMNQLKNFKNKVSKEWEPELAYGGETSFYGTFLSNYHDQEDGKTGAEDADFIDWWTDAYNYLFEVRDAEEEGIVTAEEVSELWDNDYESSIARVRQLIKSREEN